MTPRRDGLARGTRASTMALVVAAAAALGLLGCRVTLRFDQPEAGADAPNDDRSCTTDQQCSSPLPRCDRTTGRCVGCLTTSDCSGNLVCDPEQLELSRSQFVISVRICLIAETPRY